jgi:Domain of Unknown Function (DUF349)
MSDKNLQEEQKEILDTAINPSDEEMGIVADEKDTSTSKKDAPKEEIVKEEIKAEAPVEKVKNVSNDDEIEIEDEEEVSSSEEEETDDDHEIEEDIDYHSLSKKELIAEFKKLLESKPIQSIKSAAEEIRAEFQTKFSEEMEQKKEEFLEEGGNIIDFQYTTPLKQEFNSLYFDYKEKRNNHYKNLKRDLQENLAKRLELIEELKGLLNVEENINTTYKHFKEIQEKWHVAGPIPRDNYNMVWNTYRHHVENFYDFLHLNREFRDMDFKHNLEQKLKIIGRTEELAEETDLGKAFRELQMLHKMWKEDVGPVAKEYRDEVWEKFSNATKVLHDKRQSHLQEMEAVFDQNFALKKDLVAQIVELTKTTKPNHKSWQQAMKKVQEIRDQYFETGKVPRNRNKEIWSIFKEATRNFNHEKNNFYKTQKKEQYSNLEKKLELVRIAEENMKNEDLEAVTPLMKKIQQDWKNIGHVPRKDSDKIWKRFKEACNHYFDRLHAEKNEAGKAEQVNYEAKEALLKEVEDLKLSGDQEADLKLIKDKITAWKTIGRVPFKKKNIDEKFNKILDGLFGQLKLSKNEIELVRFENKLNAMVSQEDDRKLQNEEYFISKKIIEIKDEIRQLENNLGFFQHVPDDNPMVKEVNKNINRQKDQLLVWKAKMKKIRSLRQD